ncbi:MAG: PrsW family intramembrane metalloprotease [Proteobacteria bacterium]|nr:PrsW family intramembrane metalloprotease [Pseudomonadota bacterium]
MDLPLALTGALPALAAMWYFDRVDARRPEPRWTLRRVAIAGALSTIPCAAAAYALLEAAPPAPSYQRALYESFVVAAGVEELAKVLIVYWLVWRRPEFDERLDGIIYAARAGLGFALVENVLYLLATDTMKGFAVTYLLRALLAVPGHAIWAGVMGYYAAIRRFDRVGPGLIGGYLLAVLLHGSYDAAIFLGEPLRNHDLQNIAYGLLFFLPATIICGGLALRRMAQTALARDDADHGAHSV